MSKSNLAGVDTRQVEELDDLRGSGSKLKSATMKVKSLQGPLSALDGINMDSHPKCVLGGILTLLVWAATIAYITVVIWQYTQQPLLRSVETFWSRGTGLYDMEVQCNALSGCYVSNVLTDQWTANSVTIDGRYDRSVDGACSRMEPNTTRFFKLGFSSDTTEGISIVYDASTTPPNLPVMAGARIFSQAKCAPAPPNNTRSHCEDEIQVVRSPVVPGTVHLSYVGTHDEGCKRNGRERNEFFSFVSSTNGAILQNATSCDVANPPWLERTTASSNWVQARLRMQSSFVKVDVKKQSFFLVFWGTAGGGFSGFMEIAVAIFLTCTFLRNNRVTKKVVSRFAAHHHGGACASPAPQQPRHGDAAFPPMGLQHQGPPPASPRSPKYPLAGRVAIDVEAAQ